MASWHDIEDEAPELAAAVKRSFDAGKHKVMATLRRDGSPRVSGTEVELRRGEVWLGSMPGARKARDLQRDPRVAIHSPTVDTELTLGDTKISGRAVEVTDPETIKAFVADTVEAGSPEPPQPFHLFRVDVTELVCTRIGDPADHLVIESWHEGRGVSRARR